MENAASNQQTIIVVDDEADLREIIADTLSEAGYRVLSFEDGLAAQQYLLREDVSLIISDIRMPRMDGIALLKWNQSHHKIPMVLITGFSEIIETQSAFDLGANGFISKPFQIEDLLRTVKNTLLLQHAAIQSGADLDPKFGRVDIAELIAGQSLGYDIYLRLSSTQYVRVGQAGMELQPGHLTAYRKKNLHYLFAHKEDLIRHLEPSFQDTPNEAEKKIQKEAAQTLQKQWALASLSDHFQHAADLVGLAISSLSVHDTFWPQFVAFTQKSPTVFGQSAGAAFVSVILAKKLGLASNAVLYKLALCGLLHDLGNPNEAANLLKGSTTLPQEVIQTIEEHHGKLNRTKTSMISQIASASCFVAGQKTALEATVAALRKEKPQRYQVEIIDALEAMFHAPQSRAPAKAS